MNANWSLTTTAPNREAWVSRVLTRLAFDHVLFKHERPVIRRGKISQRLFPAFPRYIFVQAREQWNTVRNVSGVLRFIKDVGGEIVLPKGVVENLLSVADERGVLPMPVIEVPCRFKAGDQVEICGCSSLAGQLGIFQHLLQHDQALVMMDWFGRAVPVNIPMCDLEMKKEKETPRPMSRRGRRRQRNKHKPSTDQALP